MFPLQSCCCCSCQVASVVSDSVWPHRWQPTRLPRRWDSPGKNTGMGCHFLLQCMKVKSESEVAQSCPTLFDPMNCSLPGSSLHGIFQPRVLEWVAIAFSPPQSYVTVKSVRQHISQFLLLFSLLFCHKIFLQNLFCRHPANSSLTLHLYPLGGAFATLGFMKSIWKQTNEFPRFLLVFDCGLEFLRASLVAQMVKNLQAVWETWVQSLG